MTDVNARIESEVCVVGGGMVGAAMALAFAAAGREVVLWERQKPAALIGQLGMGVRTVALSPSSERWLTDLGIQVEGTLMQRMHVFESLGTATLDFSAGDVGEPSLGRIVENDRLVECLWAQIEREPNIRVVFDDAIQRIETDQSFATLTGLNAAVRALLCIGADGQSSSVRALAGGSVDRLDTGQWALATVVRTAKPHEGCAYQRFLPEGPVALLPGAETHLSAVVWSQTPEQAKARMAMDAADFGKQLSRATAKVLGDVLAVDQRLTFPLVQQLAADLTPALRVVLVGDAARVLHPLAGMGVNLGFEDAALLANLVGRSGDPGERRWLQAYARKRRWRSEALVRLMSGFQDIFGWQEPGAVWLRNLGVRFVNRQTFVKQQILREAMGLGAVARASH